MKRAFLFLLVVSLGANAWLLWAGARNAVELGSERQAAGKIPAASAAADGDLGLSIVALESADLGAALVALQGATDEATARAMFEGVLRRRHREKLAEVRTERTRRAWWRAGRTMQAGDADLLKQMVTEPLARLLGRDPLTVREAESRYAFLPEATRRKLALIDLDYADLPQPTSFTATTAPLQAEAAAQKLVAEERRKDVLAALTSEQRAEYDLRFSGSAGKIGNRATTMVATEREYRAMKPVLDAFEAKAGEIPKGEGFVASYEQLQETTQRELVAALGPERTREYLWSGYANFYGPMRRAADDGHIATEAPGRVMELAAQTGQRAAEVHGNARLTLEEKRAALAALQQAARAEFDALVPVDVQRSLSGEGLRWLTELGAGRYALIMPALLSSGGWSVYSLTNAPPKQRAMSPLLVPRE